MRYLSYLLLIFIFYFLLKNLDLTLFLINLKKIKFEYLFIALLISCTLPILATLRWKFIVKKFEKNVNFNDLFKSVMIAFYANVFMPAKSGDFSKAITMPKTISKYKLISAVISERIVDLISLFLLSLSGSFFLYKEIFNILIIIFIIFIILLIILRSFFKKSRDFKSAIIDKIFKIIFYVYETLFLKKKYTLFVLIFSFSIWLLVGIQIYLFFIALNNQINIFYVILLYPVTIFATMIPLSPGGVGIRESAFIFVFSKYASYSVNFTVGLMYYLFNVLFIALIGSFFINQYIWGKYKK